MAVQRHRRACRAAVLSGSLLWLGYICGSTPWGGVAFVASKPVVELPALAACRHTAQQFNQATSGLGVAHLAAVLMPTAAFFMRSRRGRRRAGLPGSRAASNTSPSMSVRRTYVLGISWYLLHFVVGLLNDGVMKFLGGSLPPFQIAFLRFMAAAAVLIPVMLLKGKESFKTVSLWMHGVRGTLLALGMGLWCMGLNLMPFASCVVINNTMPFFTMLFATALLSEKVSKERWLASIGGFLGILIVFNPTAATFQPQSFVLLLSAMCFAMLDIFNKKYAVSESTLSMLFYGSAATALVSLPRAWVTWAPVTAVQYGLFGALGIGANLLLFCLLKAFQYVDASATCPYRYTEFVLSALFGFLLFGESPQASTLLGSCIILPSVVYCAMAETREGAAQETTSAPVDECGCAG